MLYFHSFESNFINFPACIQTAGKDRSYKPLDHVDQNAKSPSDSKSSISGYESENESPENNNNNNNNQRHSPKNCEQQSEVSSSPNL